ncbi:MAG: hypothetical protein PW734_08210 [Verrucomicrobium sp.]|nr:hypothetical protein [Verrucomicrobium sp.]
MTPSPADPAVRSRLYLHAVLPCLADLAAHDLAAREILEGARGALAFRVLGGPAATVRFDGPAVCHQPCRVAPDAELLFLSSAHLNAFFSGKKWALPLPLWGFWRVGLLARFSRLAKRLEAVLDGAPAILAIAEGRRLHARLSLIAAGLGLGPLAEGDAEAQGMLRALPRGLASFSIDGEADTTVWFDNAAPPAAGWGEPPSRPAARVTFGDVETAYGALRDEIDTLAAVGSCKIRVDGLVPLADGLNFVMERLRVYLQPAKP